MDDEQIQLLDTASFGKQVDEFTKSDVGRYMLSKAESEYKEALLEFKTLDPFDHKQVGKCQLKMKLALNIRGWLTEAIRQGLEAMNQLEEMQDAETDQ